MKKITCTILGQLIYGETPLHWAASGVMDSASKLIWSNSPIERAKARAIDFTS